MGFFEPFGKLAVQKSALIEINEREKEIDVVAKIPRMRRKDIKIVVKADSITIIGEMKYEKEEKKKGYYYNESTYRRFQRMMSLPARVDPKKYKVRYANGVLKVKLKKAKKKR
ncbi:Hsp20 family protein [Candidatus Micrarchaeota archaeon]|nr:Hsp20 family protein [Candidatus Micrarchaeota archaeon]